MRKLLYILLLFPLFAQGQATYKILADSTRLGSINGTGNTLIIENTTKDSTGSVLTNIINGRTNFQKLRLQQLTDSTFILLLGTTQQGQTITISGTGGGSGTTYTLTKNAAKDSIVLTGSSGTRYAVKDSVGFEVTGMDSAMVTEYIVTNRQNAPPGAPTTGDTYLVGTAGSGLWAGQSNNIAEWGGASWAFTVPNQGDYAYVSASALTFIYRSGAWVQVSGIPILNNGNNLSTGVRFGTNNARSLSAETNNVIRFRIDSVGVLHSYYTPVASDTNVMMISPAGKITQMGKSTLLAGLGGGGGADTLTIFSVYDTDSLRLYLGNGNYTAFTYGVDSVGQTASGDSMIVYKGGVRYAYVNGTVTFGLNGGGDSLILVHNGQRFAVAYSVGGGGGAISALTAATADNAIDNAAYDQSWYWNSLAAGVGLHLRSNSTAAASNTQTLFKAHLRGANATNSQTTYAGQFINRHTNAFGSTNIGLYIEADSGITNLPLSIKGPGASEPLFKLDGTSKSYLQFFQNGVAGYYIGEWYAGSNVLAINSPDANGQIYLGTNNSADVIVYSKRLGINTTPDYPLHVTGTAVSGIIAHFSNGQIWSTNAGQMLTHFRASQAGTFGVNSSGNLEIGCNNTGSGTQIVIESGKQVGIGTTNPSDNALLTLESTTKGSLKIVGMNVTQAGALTAEDGMIIYVTNTDGTFTAVGFWGREAGAWVKL